MNETTKKTIACGAVEHLLVDYADDALGGAQAAPVQQHFKDCKACQAEVAALRRSLVFARSVWQQSAASIPAADVDRRTMVKQREPRRLPLAWAAFGVTAAAALIVGWKFIEPHIGPRPSPTIVRHMPHARRPVSSNAMPDAGHPSDPEVSEDVDIEALIHREEQAARLAMSIRILADAPNVGEDLARAKGYLRTTYGVALSNGPRNDDRGANPSEQGS